MTVLRQRLWMIPVFQWLGYIGAAYAVYLISAGLSPAWIGLWVVGHVLGGIAVSVALHRYFCHGSFKTSRFWHWFLALVSCVVVQGSPLAWATAHQTHHAFSDTKGDPHDTGLGYLVWKTYRDVPLVTWRLKGLITDPALKFVHRYTLVVIAAWVLVLLAIHPLVLVFGYLAPLGSVQLVGAVHQVVSHKDGHACDLRWLEWILPAAGEWGHEYHHDYPRHPRLGWEWWHLDYGWWFIKAIRTG